MYNIIYYEQYIFLTLKIINLALLQFSDHRNTSKSKKYAECKSISFNVCFFLNSR